MNLIALKYPNFRLYFMAGICAVNGLWIVRILIGWLAWSLTGSASFVGFVAALSLLPPFLTGPFFGVLVDRANIKWAALATNSAMLICVLTLLAAHITGHLTPTVLALITTAIGVAASAHHPVRLSLGPRLVDAKHVGSVVALAALNFNTARMISPALGGIIINGFGITWALALSILLSLPSLLVITFLKPRATQKPTSKEPFLVALGQGFQYLWQRPELRTVIALTALMSLSIRGSSEILPVVADGIFAKGALGLGQLGSAMGLGALGAALIKSMGAIRKETPVPAMTHVVAAFGFAAVALFGASTVWPASLTAAAALGFCSTYLGVSLQSAVQADLPDGMRGRVMSIWIVVSTGASALGALTIGFATEKIGLPVSGFVLSGFCLVLLGKLVLSSKKTGG
ncbi:MAG: MFS transporter [Rhodobacterales bacterium]